MSWAFSECCPALVPGEMPSRQYWKAGHMTQGKGPVHLPISSTRPGAAEGPLLGRCLLHALLPKSRRPNQQILSKGLLHE